MVSEAVKEPRVHLGAAHQILDNVEKQVASLAIFLLKSAPDWSQK